MPTWIIIISSIFSFTLIAGGAMFFPYVPMVFGVLDNERDSVRSKLIIKLIWLFPIIATISLYQAWTSNSYFAIAPFIHFAIIYSIRANKNASAGSKNEYSSMQENLDAKMVQINHYWSNWECLNPNKSLAIFTFYAPTFDIGTTLKDKLIELEKNCSSVELAEPFKNGSVILDVEFTLNLIDKTAIETITKQLIELAWDTQCELKSLDVMEDSE